VKDQSGVKLGLRVRGVDDIVSAGFVDVARRKGSFEAERKSSGVWSSLLEFFTFLCLKGGKNGRR